MVPNAQIYNCERGVPPGASASRNGMSVSRWQCCPIRVGGCHVQTPTQATAIKGHQGGLECGDVDIDFQPEIANTILVHRQCDESSGSFDILIIKFPSNLDRA